jgi:hypothetical protein
MAYADGEPASWRSNRWRPDLKVNEQHVDGTVSDQQLLAEGDAELKIARSSGQFDYAIC